MNKPTLLIIVLALNSILFSQEIEMTGTISDSKTGRAIEFVNIGVFNKNIGTVSNANGQFSLTLAPEFSTDSLTVSHVSYETIKIPILTSKNIEITLEPRSNELEEIVITNKKKKTRKKGVKSFNRLLWLGATARNDDILENAQRIQIPNKTSVRVKNVNFLLRKGFASDSCLIRINFYKNDNYYPGERIVFENIIEKKFIEPGWMTFDLADYDVYIENDFYVGVEFIPDFKNKRQVYLGAILTKGKGYSRRSSQGKWNKLQGASSINVEIEY